MACFESGTVITLSAREAISLPDVQGATLRVRRGTLWLTQERDPQDVVLRPGDNWVIEADGKTVVEAQDDATVWLVGRKGAALKLREPKARSRSPWTALTEWFGLPLPHHAPYV